MTNPNEYHLLVFDPGAAATGWAWFCVDFRAFSRPDHKVLRWLKFWDCGEFTGPETTILKSCADLIAESQNQTSFLTTQVVSEDFELTQMIGGDNLLSPVRINSVLSWECHKRSIKFKLQKRQLRTSVTRDRLKLYGFDGKFKKDEFAAMQHGVVWLRRTKKETIKRPWKLSDGSRLNAHWDCACATNRKNQCDLIHP